MGACEMTSDVAIEDMDTHVTTILKYSQNSSQKSVIGSQFEVILNSPF